MHILIASLLVTPLLEHPIANEPSYYDSNDSEDDSTMYSIRDTSRYAQHDSSNRTGVRRMKSSIASGRVAPTLGVGRQTTLSVTDASRFGLQASGVEGRQNTNTLSVTDISRFGVQARPTQGLSVSAAGRTTTGVTGLSVSDTSRFAYTNENSQGPTSQLSTVNSSQRAAPSIIDNSRFAYANENSQGPNS
ncbi:hypothetical protein TrLO_g13077 [Triparma laevis f. longispina]|uniref:Uncharacterized protein n=1 Tax=Triparma laevis f. longispina TaxID=1714387 RepID=A0A9W7FKK0_9STRA|nr:hypothetical protein TrLO_g13077 [Triparma laevis f. longispina]